jgi:hypothetical protein
MFTGTSSSLFISADPRRTPPTLSDHEGQSFAAGPSPSAVRPLPLQPCALYAPCLYSRVPLRPLRLYSRVPLMPLRLTGPRMHRSTSTARMRVHVRIHPHAPINVLLMLLHVPRPAACAHAPSNPRPAPN